jgi:hypothetical protein
MPFNMNEQKELNGVMLIYNARYFGTIERFLLLVED